MSTKQTDKGKERRDGKDRRVSRSSRYAGPDRRRSERRAEPYLTPFAGT
jgi:hypothetical protein